jgi:hypothetical protein
VTEGARDLDDLVMPDPRVLEEVLLAGAITASRQRSPATACLPR